MWIFYKRSVQMLFIVNPDFLYEYHYRVRFLRKCSLGKRCSRWNDNSRTCFASGPLLSDLRTNYGEGSLTCLLTIKWRTTEHFLCERILVSPKLYQLGYHSGASIIRDKYLTSNSSITGYTGSDERCVLPPALASFRLKRLVPWVTL